MKDYEDKRQQKPEDKTTLGDIMNERTSSDEADLDRANRVAGIESSAESLPLGTGYHAEDLPTQVKRPLPELLDRKIPDKVRQDELAIDPKDPVPSPEDEFYDFDKDIYGDDT